MPKTCIIGIAGGSASGKSTVSDQLEKMILNSDCGKKVKVFHMDEYFKAPEQRPQSKAPVMGITYMDDNHPETMELERLYEDILSEKNKNEDAPDIIIVEGILTLWHGKIFSLLDLKVFIDCRADERIVRRIRRNMRDRGLSYDEIANVYLDLVRYRHDEYVEPTRWKADIILNGSNPSDKAMKMLLDFVEKN